MGLCLQTGYRVVTKYKSSADPRSKESEIIRNLRRLGRTLVNDLSAFDYREADEAEKKLRVQRFLDTLLQN
jgi:hypothetical protein